MTKMIACAALVAFTRYVPGYGMVHGDPENADAKKVNVPEEKVVDWATEGLIKAPKQYLADMKAAADAEAAEVEAAELAAREAAEAAAAAAAAADPDAPPA